MMEHKTVRGLVLAGGGAKGSYHVGVYRALKEQGWYPDIITGASVGSLNGVLFAMGREDEAEELWRTMEMDGVIDLPKNLTMDEMKAFLADALEHGGLNVTPLAERVDKVVDETAVRSSRIKFGLVITEKDNLRSIHCPVETIPEGQLRDYLLASSACFPALRPHTINGVEYIDGGWRDNMPLGLAKEMGATELIGVDIEGIGITKPNHTGLPTVVLRSHWDLGPILDFNPERAVRNIALGYYDTLRHFGKMGGTAYAILPDADEYAEFFIRSYHEAQEELFAIAPELRLAGAVFKQSKGFPIRKELGAAVNDEPTPENLASLELVAEHLGIDPGKTYTVRQLVEAVKEQVEGDPTEKFPALFNDMPGIVVAERAKAVAEPEQLMLALVWRAAQGAV